MSGGDCSNEEKVTVAYYAHASHRTKQVHSELHSPDNKNNKEMSAVSKKKKKKKKKHREQDEIPNHNFIFSCYVIFEIMPHNF